MFCPQCGQERLSVKTSFCSRCGFLLTGAADLLQTGGLIPRLYSAPQFHTPSPRSRGIRQGLFTFLLSFLIVPLIVFFSVFVIGVRPFAAIFAAIILVASAILRAAYAVMFESSIPGASTIKDNRVLDDHNSINRPANAHLPPQQAYPAASYAAPATGNWRDTNDLEPHSVTEGTTRLLENEELPQ